MPTNKKGGNHTRKNRKSFHDSADCGITMHGLHNWYKSMFEKLGWMILAKHKKYNSKIIGYKSSLKILKSELENKLEHVESHDDIIDLKIMHHDICVLIEHVNKDFR